MAMDLGKLVYDVLIAPSGKPDATPILVGTIEIPVSATIGGTAPATPGSTVQITVAGGGAVDSRYSDGGYHGGGAGGYAKGRPDDDGTAGVREPVRR